MSPTVASIDFGGTKTMVGLVNAQGEVLQREGFPTPQNPDPHAFFELCREKIGLCLRRQGWAFTEVEAVGVTVPGYTDRSGERLIRSHVPPWKNVAVGAILGDIFPGVPVKAANDVNACALGELRFNPTVPRDFLWVTVSTGIGGAAVADGMLLAGAHGMAGEFGHMAVEYSRPRPCNCGGKGCLEAHASGRAMAARLREKLALGELPGFLRWLQSHGAEPDMKAASEALREGVSEAQALFDEAGMYLGRGFASLCNALDPEAIYIGGGMGLSLAHMLPAIEKEMTGAVVGGRHVPVLCTALGYDAGLLGGAALGIQALEQRR